MKDNRWNRKWVQALRSNKYNQGVSRLRQKYSFSRDQFCCLGVACDLVDPTKWENGYESYDSVIVFAWGGIGIATLDARMRRKFGMTKVEMNKLTNFNDRGKSFEFIADQIDEMCGRKVQSATVVLSE